MSQIDSMLKFLQFLVDFQHIERIVYVQGFTRKENDVEHSYQLAMLCWFAFSENNLSLDLHKVISYALVHDLVEVYAGDTYAFSQDAERYANKKQRERDALVKIEKTFSSFGSLTALIAQYEKKEDAESRFVYAMDKIIPDMNNILSGGVTYKKHNETLAMLDTHAGEKTKVDPFVHDLWKQIRTILVQKHDELFPKM